MKLFTVAELLEAKSSLYRAYVSNPTTSLTYQMTKYVKIPVLQDGTETMISLRPNDVVEAISLPRDGINTIIKMRFVCSHNLDIADEKFVPKWKQEKLIKWLAANCKPINEEAEDMGDFL